MSIGEGDPPRTAAFGVWHVDGPAESPEECQYHQRWHNPGEAVHTPVIQPPGQLEEQVSAIDPTG